jgi:hypothetical protein
MKAQENDKVTWTMWIVMAVIYAIMRLAVWIMGEQA